MYLSAKFGVNIPTRTHISRGGLIQPPPVALWELFTPWLLGLRFLQQYTRAATRLGSWFGVATKEPIKHIREKLGDPFARFC